MQYLGQLQSLQIGDYSALQFGHNQLGQETQRTNGVGFNLSHGHNRDGLLMSQQLLPSEQHLNQDSVASIVGQAGTHPRLARVAVQAKAVISIFSAVINMMRSIKSAKSMTVTGA